MKERMLDLITILNAASAAYYNGEEIMSNKEYDALFDELVALETRTGEILPDSPTQKVGAEVVSELATVKHEYPAKSLDKTKDVNEIVNAISAVATNHYADEESSAVLMWKLDGATIVCTYEGGKLVRAVTRGNGEVGNDITHNAPYIKGFPITIPNKDRMVIRGEATMSYSEFERIASQMSEDDEKYKNPRNLANATIRLFDSREMRKREIWFYGFNLVYAKDMPVSFEGRLEVLRQNGINVVPYECCNARTLKNAIERWGEKVSEYDVPVDGLVIAYNNAAYADTLPGTGHHPHVLSGYAFKWEDEAVETILREIEWSASRTGLLNPVAIFDPVELEGTTVSRASLHNISYIMDKDLQIGDKITVYKANKIIPQVAENLSSSPERQKVKISSRYSLAKNCPVCKEVTGINTTNDTMTLRCVNPYCPAKMIGKFVHFCERDCMNIKDMSEATIEKFVRRGFLKEFADFWHLDRFKEEIITMEGFGEKSYENIIAATEKARNTDFVSFLHALGIPNIGKGQAKIFSKEYGGDIMKFLQDCCNGTDFTTLEGIGDVIHNAIHKYIFIQMQSGPEHSDCEITRLLKELRFEVNEIASSDMLKGKVFVITGSLNHFANREECQTLIESLGGKASGSVSAKTSFLINNDTESISGKNKKAKELNIPIISEDEFLKMIGR